MSVVLGLSLAFALQGQGATTPASPIYKFLMAADADDYATMASLLSTRNGGMKAAALLSKLQGCYLRRVYGDRVSGETIAAWMCAEGNQKSRVVIGRVSGNSSDVSVVVVREDRNDRPAPTRNGSALSDDKNG